MDNITELEDRVLRLTEELTRAQEELNSARRKKIGIEVGDLVIITDGRIYKVHSIHFHSFAREKPWLKGCVKRKDGTFSERPIHLYDQWTKVK